MCLHACMQVDENVWMSAGVCVFVHAHVSKCGLRCVHVGDGVAVDANAHASFFVCVLACFCTYACARVCALQPHPTNEAFPVMYAGCGWHGGRSAARHAAATSGGGAAGAAGT